MINSGTNLGFYGEYNLVVTKPNGDKYETGWFKNVITDIGLDRVGTYSASLNSYDIIAIGRIGTGNSPPSFTNTQLDNQSAFSSSWVTRSDSRSGYNVTRTWTFSFAQGAAVGNMAEIGVGWANTGATLFSRALILDGSGNPTTLTLTSIDQLTAYYRLTMVPSTSDITGTFTLSGVTYNYTGRPASINSWITGGNTPFPTGITGFGSSDSQGFGGSSSTLGAITGQPTSLSYAQGSISQSTYVNGTRYRTVTFSYSTSQSNLAGGIKTILIYTWNSGSYFQYEITPTIPKDNTKTLSFSLTYSWNRV